MIKNNLYEKWNIKEKKKFIVVKWFVKWIEIEYNLYYKLISIYFGLIEINLFEFEILKIIVDFDFDIE
jgi:hypothetical protein